MPNLTRYDPQLPSVRASVREMERISKVAQTAMHEIGTINAYAAYKAVDATRTIDRLAEDSSETTKAALEVYKQQLVADISRVVAVADEQIVEKVARRMR